MENNRSKLLLADLCARLPYGVKGQCQIDASYDTSFDTITNYHIFDAELTGIKDDLLYVIPLIGIEDLEELEFANEEVAEGISIYEFKPYLRRTTNMTEEENSIYEQLLKDVHFKPRVSTCLNLNEWLNANHFDYRGLIETGLAIEVPTDYYKLNN